MTDLTILAILIFVMILLFAVTWWPSKHDSVDFFSNEKKNASPQAKNNYGRPNPPKTDKGEYR